MANGGKTNLRKQILGLFKRICIFVWKHTAFMKFEIIFLTEAREFLLQLDEKSRDKIIFNIDKAKATLDKELFKKLKDEIWEFRTFYNKTYYRIFTFWDKENKHNTLVLATHGIVKKTAKVPEKEIKRTQQIRLNYFELKNNRKK